MLTNNLNLKYFNPKIYQYQANKKKILILCHKRQKVTAKKRTGKFWSNTISKYPELNLTSCTLGKQNQYNCHLDHQICK